MSTEWDRQIFTENGGDQFHRFKVTEASLVEMARLKDELGMEADEVLLLAIGYSGKIYERVLDGFLLYAGTEQINITPGQESWKVKTTFKPPVQRISANLTAKTYFRITDIATNYNVEPGEMLDNFIRLFAYLEDKFDQQTVLTKEGRNVPVYLPLNPKKIAITVDHLQEFLNDRNPQF